MKENIPLNILVAERFSKEPQIDTIKQAESLATKLEAQGKSIIKLNIGRPNFRPPEVVMDKYCFLLKNQPLGYSPMGGMKKTRALIAKHVDWLPFRLNEENVLYTDGGCHAIDIVIRMLCNPGDRVIAPDPMWAVYSANARNSATICDAVPYFSNDDVAVDNLESVFVKGKTKVIIVNTPENPTGRVIDSKQLEQLANFAQKHDITIISDEVYQSLSFEPHVSISKFAPERTIVIDSFSKKGAIPGARAGVVYAHAPLIKRLEEIDRGSSGSPSLTGQYLVWALLEEKACPIAGMRDELRKRRDLVVNYMQELGWQFVAPRGAFYAFPDIGCDADSFADRLVNDAGVSVVSGSSFGPSGKNCIRISYGSANCDDLTEAFKRIKIFLGRV